MYVKTNKFKVNNEDKLKELISNLSMCNSSECELQKYSDGSFSFGCEDNIWGYPISENEGDVEYSYDYFLNTLQSILTEDSILEIEECIEDEDLFRTIISKSDITEYKN